MTSRQNGNLDASGYGLGWSVFPGVIGHGGAYKNAMDIDLNHGRIYILMVQQSGPWGTAAGDKLLPTLERLAATAFPAN